MYRTEERADVREFLSALGRVRLSINFLELFTTLIFTGKMEPHVEGLAIPVPPNYTLTIYIAIPPNKISISAEWRLTVDTDHALSLEVYVDDKKVFSDSDVVQQNYARPINFFQIGSLLPAKRNIIIKLMNKTSSTVNVNLWEAYGRVDDMTFENIMKRYFDVILEEIKGRRLEVVR